MDIGVRTCKIDDRFGIEVLNDGLESAFERFNIDIVFGIIGEGYIKVAVFFVVRVVRCTVNGECENIGIGPKKSDWLGGHGKPAPIPRRLLLYLSFPGRA